MFSPFPEAEVERAIELSGLSALVAERGGDYLCGENGSGLSGGEGQRVSIARSLLRRSEVLLVDEATAALDAATAYQVTDSILSLEGMTRILVTHSLDAALLQRCDRILALRGGRIVESGTFDELMSSRATSTHYTPSRSKKRLPARAGSLFSLFAHISLRKRAVRSSTPVSLGLPGRQASS